MVKLEEEIVMDTIKKHKKHKKDKKEKKHKKKKSKDREEADSSSESLSPSPENSPEPSPKKRKTEATSSPEPAIKKHRKFDENGDEDKTNDVVTKPEPVLPEAVKDGAFENFRISAQTIEKLKARKVNYLFPVQANTYDDIYDGIDVVAQARTGTGKTFSFAIPVVERLQQDISTERGRPPKTLVMAPTRELAKQVADDFLSISTNLEVLSVYGGSPYEKQESVIWRGVDVVVGTPGRILDFAQKGTLDLSKLKFVILDEVDRMLDMGFADVVDDILQYGYKKEEKDKNPQTLLFSATLPPWVYTTAKKYMMSNYRKIDLVGKEGIQTSTTVQHLAIKCGYHDRASTIGDVLKVYSGNHGRAMIFCQTKKDADELAVSTYIKQETHVLHGDIPQDKREMVLKSYREGRYKVLITTDVAARGLDIPEVDLVIQCNPPKDVDSYIHRSGRTGRAGRPGTCVCFYKPNEEYGISQVERKAGITFKKVGAPTMEDIISSAAEDSLRSLDSIPEATLRHFMGHAERLITEKGAQNALAAALAVISGSTELKSRSLLSSQEGYTTWLFRTNQEMERMGYCWRSLERQIPEDVKEQVMRMRMCKDKMGAVFDLPSELDSTIEDRWTDGKWDTLCKATELPELEEQNNGFGGRGYGGRGGGRFGGGGGGGGRFGGGQKRSFDNAYKSNGRGGGYRGNRGGGGYNRR